MLDGIAVVWLTWSLPPHSPLPGFSRGLTSKLRHDHCRILRSAYVDPFARNWLGFSTTDPDNCNAVKVKSIGNASLSHLAAKASRYTSAAPARLRAE